MTFANAYLAKWRYPQFSGTCTGTGLIFLFMGPKLIKSLASSFVSVYSALCFSHCLLCKQLGHGKGPICFGFVHTCTKKVAAQKWRYLFCIRCILSFRFLLSNQHFERIPYLYRSNIRNTKLNKIFILQDSNQIAQLLIDELTIIIECIAPRVSKNICIIDRRLFRK